MPEIRNFAPAPTESVTAPTPISADFHVAPSFDVIEALPPAAADRLRALRQRSKDSHALSVPYEKIREASMARIEAANALTRLTNHAQDFGLNLKPDNPSVVQAKRTLDKAADDFKRLTELQAARTAAWQSSSWELANVETWLREGRPGNTVLEDYEIPGPKLAKGESGILDAIENRRRRVRELRADLHRVESAPFPSSHCKAQMRAQIEARATQGAPSVSNLVEHDGKIEFQTQRITSEVHAEKRSLAFTEAPDAVALVAWLHKDALVAALDREIDAEADDPAALSTEARQTRAAEILDDLLDIERQEAAMVFTAQSEGLPCEHRAECAPQAILGCRLIVAPRAEGDTSVRQGYDILGR